MPDTSPELPRKVALFSGHMIDAPGRENPRFPPNKEPIAARAIAEGLADLGFGPVDLAICGGACGGDLLFADAALARGARLELYIPFDESAFLEKSIDFADRDWRPVFRCQGVRYPSRRPERARSDPGRAGRLRAQQPLDARFGAPLWSRQGRFHLPVERRGRRRAGRHAPHDGRDPEPGWPDALARHDQALGLRPCGKSLVSWEGRLDEARSAS
jgi:hypothetical protein